MGDGGEVSIQLEHQNLEPAHRLQLREYRAALLERPSADPSEALLFESAAEFGQRRHDFAARIAGKPGDRAGTADETRTALKQVQPRFEPHANCSQAASRAENQQGFVKRVIAQEVDSVRIVGGRVYVNQVPLREDYVDAAFRSYEDWGPEVISAGYYFVMGDRRNGSMDSRDWGLVPKRYIIGKVKIRWWPLGHVAVF